MSVSGCYSVQRSLSTGQAIPVVGPLVVSPIKAVFSVAQLIAGIAGSILFGTLAIVSNFTRPLDEIAFKSLQHAGLGLIGLMYSVSNMLSLGIVAYRFEVAG